MSDNSESSRGLGGVGSSKVLPDDSFINPADLPRPAPVSPLQSATGEVPLGERELLREESRASLFFFAKGILGMKDLHPEIHGPICLKLEQWLEGRRTNNRVKIVLPRSSFKSSLCTIAFPIWLALNDPNITILIAQNTSSNAVKKMNEIDSVFKQNKLFIALFPELLPTKAQTWKTDSMCVPRDRTVAESTFECCGVKTQVVSRHYDVIIEDDTVAPDNDEMGEGVLVPTKDDIGKAIGFHQLCVPLFVNYESGMWLVVGTRWFETDLLSWIDVHQKDFWKYERAVRETDGHPDENGKIIWPERFSETMLDAILSTMGPYLFSCLYLNKPVNSGTQSFQLDWFEYYETEELSLVVTTTVDPGGDPEDTKGKPDYNVVCTTGKSLISGKIYVLEVSKGLWSPSELLENLFRHVQKWHPVKVGIETVQYQKSLLHWVRKLQIEKNVYFVVEGITNTRKSKNARILGLQPLVHSRNLLFRRHQQTMVQELLVFPNGANDDEADALSMHLPLWTLTISRKEQERPSTVGDPLSVTGAIEELEKKMEKKTVNRVFDLLGDVDDDEYEYKNCFTKKDRDAYDARVVFFTNGAVLSLFLSLLLLTGCFGKKKEILHSNDLAYAMKDNTEAVQALDRKDAGSVRLALDDQTKHLLAHDKWTSHLWEDYQGALDGRKESDRQLELRKLWWFGDRSWWWIYFLEAAVPITIVTLMILNRASGGMVHLLLAPVFSFIGRLLLAQKKRKKYGE